MLKSQCRQLLRERGICVIIPTYNNAGTLRDVVMRALAHCDDVIVVNDGSTDSTAEILHSISGIEIVLLKSNSGKGAALKHGFEHALRLGFAYAITLDSDGQHFPEDIPALLDANIRQPDALIVGSRRFGDAQRTAGSRFANSFSNFWFAVQTLRRLPDTQTGYRLYPLKKLHGLSLLTSRYEAELELLVFAAWHGVKIRPVEVNVYYPPIEERVSHFRPGADFARISVLNTALCVLAIVYALPLALWRGAGSLIFTCFSLFVYLFGTLGVIMPFSLVYVPLCRLRGEKPWRLYSLLHWFGRLVTRLLGLFGVKVTVRDRHSHDFSKPSVLICNHQSHLDLMVLLSLTPKIIFLTNDWVWKSPFFGYFIRHAGYYPVSEGIDALTPKLKELTDSGYSVCVFPEGTRSSDGEIMRFHKGAFHLSAALGLPVTPMVLYGANRVLPKGTWWMHRWPICLEICDSIETSDLGEFGATEREICKSMRRFYKEKYENLCNELDREA